MDPATLLQTHAEVAIALAGFASVIAALSRPLSTFALQRFFSLLALSVIQILGCLLPLWALRLVEAPTHGWRMLSALLLVLNLARLRWLVMLPNRELGEESSGILNPLITRFTWGMGYLGLGLFLLNSIGVGFRPNFELYYAGLIVTLLVGFVLFADVASRES